MGLDGDPGLEETEASMIQWIWTEISSSYLNIGLTAAILYLIYKILFQKDEEPVFNAEPPTPPMKKQVFSLNNSELCLYSISLYLFPDMAGHDPPAAAPV